MVSCKWLDIVLMAVSCLLPECGCSTICFSCTDLQGSDTCHNVIQCGDREICYTQKYMNRNNETLYSFGCTYPELCRKDSLGALFGRRSTEHSHVLCNKCCDSTVCNIKLDCNDNFKAPSLSCLSCGGVDSVSFCRNTTTCRLDEVCYIHKYKTKSDQTLYDLGCKRSTACLNRHQSISSKRTNTETHLICESCCNEFSLCNRNIACSILNQKNINESCLSSSECASNLVCKIGKCSCPNADNVWVNNSCVIHKTVGQKCEKTTECSSSLQCIDHVCKCPSIEYWNNTHCIPQSNINESCLSSSECTSNLVCHVGKCTCPNADYVWANSTCVIHKTAGEKCEKTMECSSSLQCIDHVCKCPSREYWNSTHCRPQKTIGEKCRLFDECLNTLYCNHGECKCDRIDYWTGQECSQKKTVDQKCQKTTECSSPLQCIDYVCKCPSKEYWNITHCLPHKTAGEKCEKTMECSSSLQCIDHVCKCPSREYWNTTHCGPQKTIGEKCRFYDECSFTLYCNHGECKCDRIDYWTGHKCSPKITYMEMCLNDTDCQESETCINDTCTCIHSFWNGLRCQKQKPVECADIDFHTDGPFIIYPKENEVQVICAIREGTKWTVFQRRFDGSVNFDRNWNEYKVGFGTVNGEYWLGNDILHQISSNGQHQLLVQMTEDSQIYYAQYSNFLVETESNKYRLHVTGYHGNAGNSLNTNQHGDHMANGMSFTTKDRDNDRDRDKNCAIAFVSGWWHNACGGALLNQYPGLWAYDLNWDHNITSSLLMLTRN